MAPQIIHFDYEFSPYGQKTKILLHQAGVSFKRCDQPPALPRKDLEELGITYRRIPLLAIGRDVYCDSHLIIETILHGLAKKDVLQDKLNDRAWESWGTETFLAGLQLAPAHLLSDDFVKDRSTIFPILGRSDFKLMRAPGVADLKSRLSFVENVLLSREGKEEGPFIHGKELSLQDLHIIWCVRWVLNDLGAKEEKGLGREDFPKVWALIDALPKVDVETISSEEAIKTVREGEIWAGQVGVEPGDPLGIESGTNVTVESVDSTPNSHPQAGKLLGASRDEVVLELENGIRVHFPREGYLVKKA